MRKLNINPSYETNSYVFVNETIKLNLGIENSNITWKSEDEEIAIVNNGIVKGITEGNVCINSYLEEELLFSFNVLVLEKNTDEIINDLLEAHNSNIYHNNDIWIDGRNGYQADIYESVSKLLFNYDLKINDYYLNQGNQKWEKQWNEYLQSLEFITVHYTGNVNSKADANAHGRYFVNFDEPTSIHYCTGNDGVYICLDNNKRAAHAGDSAGPVFQWLDTGVEYDGCDLRKVKVSVSKDFHYVINDKKTLIKLPETYVYKDRKTKHVYSDNGLIQIQDTDKFVNAEDMFNKLGFEFIVKDNRYYMSQTWWCYTQKYEGAICNVGGNRNSIGIESSVNEGSDLWFTWQITAKLVAKLLINNKLELSRVKPHHFFSAKNCPQPMMENDLEIWKKFIELVKCEYLFMTKYKDYDILFEKQNANINDNGRVLKSCLNTLSYKVTIKSNKKDFHEKTLLLSSIVK